MRGWRLEGIGGGGGEGGKEEGRKGGRACWEVYRGNAI